MKYLPTKKSVIRLLVFENNYSFNVVLVDSIEEVVPETKTSCVLMGFPGHRGKRNEYLCPSSALEVNSLRQTMEDGDVYILDSEENRWIRSEDLMI